MTMRVATVAAVLVALAVLASAVPVRDLITPATADIVYVPSVGPMYRECTHALEEGDEIVGQDASGAPRIARADGSVDVIPVCRGTPTEAEVRKTLGGASTDGDFLRSLSGWQAWSTMNVPAGFNSMTSQFAVPPEPTRPERTNVVFLFPGLQSDNWVPSSSSSTAPPSTSASPASSGTGSGSGGYSGGYSGSSGAETRNVGTFNPPPMFDIIQPVVQYGISAAGTVHGWGLASWYVTVSHGAVYSKLKLVQPGGVINGTMYRTGSEDWFIGSNIVGDASSVTNINVANRPQLTKQSWAYITLECYGIHECDAFPGTPTSFYDITLTDSNNNAVTPQWQWHLSKQSECAINISGSPTNVTIAY